MKSVAILTSLNMPDLMPYDIEVIGMLNDSGRISAKPIIWETQARELINFDAAIFRTTWGYHEKPQQFLDFFDFLDDIKIPTLNPMKIIRRNFHKFYLRDLIDRGYDVIPTRFIPKNSCSSLSEIIIETGWNKFIVKPAISAGSYRTHLFGSAEIQNAGKVFDELNRTDDLLVQQYLEEVETLGEFSTIYFNGGYNYTVNKIPQHGDYRVQFTYGGKYRQIEPDEAIREATRQIASQFVDECLYVRVDGLYSEGRFMLMEVEMLEPDLYMNINPQAKQEFVKAILRMI
jgi:glutathione synthase/RimK-type ligase-like ATP-grasp enzyme